MTFELQYNDPKSNARAGLITTDHGKIETPIFMPVGTLGSVKGIHLHELKDDIKAQIILGNTYHLYLRPGLEVIEGAGGLHKFNGFDKPIPLLLTEEMNHLKQRKRVPPSRKAPLPILHRSRPLKERKRVKKQKRSFHTFPATSTMR